MYYVLLPDLDVSIVVPYFNVIKLFNDELTVAALGDVD